MKKIFLIAAVACLSATTAFAQNNKPGAENQVISGPFISNTFWDNWSVSAGVGVDSWVNLKKSAGEQYRGLDKFSYVFQLGAAKWFHPYWGVRGQFNYGNVKGYTSVPGPYAKSASGNNFNLDFNYWALEADLMFNLSNAVGGYKEARFYNAILFGGFGFDRSSGENIDGVKSKNGEYAVNAGLLNTFRLSSALDVYLEMKLNTMSQTFAGATGGTVGVLPSLSLGFTYKFNKRNFSTAKSAIDDAVANATLAANGRINNLERELAAAEARAKKAQAEADAAKKVVPAPVSKLGEYDLIPVGFFERGKSDLVDMNKTIEYAAGLIKANPDKVYVITGLADKETGTHQINMNLGKERAENVRKALIKAGVPAKQLEVNGLGDTFNPYGYADLNRVAVLEVK